MKLHQKSQHRWDSCCSSVVSFAQHVNIDYDIIQTRSVQTYSWKRIQTKDSPGRPHQECCDSALAAKGWTEVSSGGDVEVFAIETTQNQQTLDTFYNGFEGGRRWGGFGGGFGNATTTLKPTRWGP